MKTLEDFLSEIEDRACDQCGSAEAFTAARIIREMKRTLGVYSVMSKDYESYFNAAQSDVVELAEDCFDKISQILNEEE